MKFKNIILLLTFLASVNLHAQYSEMASIHAGKYFKPVNAEFSLSDIATTLGCNAATLASDFNQWQNADDENPWNGDNLLYLVDPVNGEIDTYTMDGNGFYLNRAGGLDHWGTTEGNAGVWYVFGEVDAGNDLLKFNIGMSNALPETIQPLASLEQVTCNLVLKYNGRQATFALTLNVTDPIAIPTPTTIVESELNVVGSKQVLVEQYPRSGWNSDLVTVVLDDIQSKLNIDKELLVNELDSLLYCTQYNNAETIAEGQGLKKTELTNHSTADEPGFWLAAIMDEGGEYTGECSSVDYNGAARKFFIEQFAFDATTNELTCRLGQEPNALTKEESLFVNIYIIYGDKAYHVRYDLSIMEHPTGTGMANFVKKGETEVVIEQVFNKSYLLSAIYPDLDNIATVLGCNVTDLNMKALDSSGNFASNSANKGGFYFSTDGFVTSWSDNSAAFGIEPMNVNNYSTLNVFQHERNILKPGDQASANLYFMYSDEAGSGYYQYKVTLMVIAEAVPDSAFESVASLSINAQTLITTDYSCTQEKQIDEAEVAALIGTDSPTLYGWALDENIVEGVNGEYSKAYSCDPKPGFWLTEEGRVSIWNDGNTKVGISYLADGTFRFFQKPNTHAVGDVFKCQLFLVNEETGDMVTCNIKLKFVDEIGPDDEDAEIVGEVSNVLIPLDTEVSVPFNLNLAAEALGVTIDDLMDMNCLRGGTNGEFGTLVALTDGISYNSETFEYDPAGDIYLVFDQNGDEVEVTVMGFEVAEDFSKNIEFCIEVEGKRFIYHAKLVSLQGYATGIIESQNNISFSDSSLSIAKGQTHQLIVFVGQVATEGTNFLWRSTDESVATVNANGVVTALNGGNTLIIATLRGAETRDTCYLTVTTSPVSGIQLSESAVTIHKGLTHLLTATVLPSDAGNTNVIWSSTDEAVATVDENGFVTAVGKGTAMIIALTEEGYKSAMCTVTVDNVVTSVTLNNEALTIAKGGTAQLTATCTPADADDLSLTWASSDETVATVDATGLVTAIGKGTATITVTAATGVSAQCVVTVTNPMTSFRFANATLTLQKGSSQALTLVPTPVDADPVTLVWSSTDETVATVDGNGVLTAIDLGTTVVVAYSPDLNKSATCVVTVTKKDITLADGTPYANNTEEECGTITYTRTFNNTNFQALYVPFEMSYADWQADFEVYYIDNIRQHDDNGDGVIDRTMMDIFLLKEGSSLYANMPYIIRAKTTGEKTITLTDATLYPAEENSLECSSTSMRYTITGTYEGVSSSMMDVNSWYALGGGSLIQTDGSNDLGAFRWYLSAESKGGVFKNSLPNEIKLQVINDDETGIGNLNVNLNANENCIYDLSGRRVNANAYNSKSKIQNSRMPKGMYIVNGRKVVIK